MDAPGDTGCRGSAGVRCDRAGETRERSKMLPACTVSASWRNFWISSAQISPGCPTTHSPCSVVVCVVRSVARTRLVSSNALRKLNKHETVTKSFQDVQYNRYSANFGHYFVMRTSRLFVQVISRRFFQFRSLHQLLERNFPQNPIDILSFNCTTCLSFNCTTCVKDLYLSMCRLRSLTHVVQNLPSLVL